MNNYLLIVDDMEINRDILRLMFENEYQVLEAASGTECIRLAREYEGRLSLVLLDLQMPDITGLEILRMKNRGELLADTPVIIITVNDDPKSQIEAFQLGALDYITKPFIKEIVQYRVANTSLRATCQELNQLVAEKEEALVLAKEASQAKGHFLSRMSHEIRTPMNAIIGLTDLMRCHQEDPSFINDSLRKVDYASHYLLALLNNVLDFSKTENGKTQLKEQPADFQDFLSLIDMMIRNSAAKKEISYEMQISGAFDQEYCFDSVRLQQILLNILTNAVKFTEDGGKISMQIQAQTKSPLETQVEFIIRDTGIGISGQFLPYIFDSFSQEESGTTSAFDGAGLGLAIAREYVDLMHGSIEVSSKKGDGTAFTVIVPLKRILHDTDTVSREARPDFSGKKLLVVEDNKINLMIISKLLKDYGFEFQTATNGLEGLERFRQSHPHHYAAILMDIRMPFMDGLEATREIRKLDHLDAASIPIIAITANTSPEDVQNCLDAGMNAHIGKPVDPAVLISTLAHFILNEAKSTL